MSKTPAEQILFDDVDPGQTFADLPNFLHEGYCTIIQQLCSELRVLCSDVPTSSIHGCARKLQAHGYPKIAKHIRSLHQLEEALKVGRAQVEYGQCEAQQRATTPGGSRPGTEQSMTLQHNYKKTATSLATSLLACVEAHDIVKKSNPRNAEIDPAPRNSWFLTLMVNAVEASSSRIVKSREWETWHQRLIQHQERRNTHAEGDVAILKDVLLNMKVKAHEKFSEADFTTSLLVKQLVLARESIEKEESFENNLQKRWHKDIGGMVSDRCAAMQAEIQDLEKKLLEMKERHEDERLRKKKAISKAQRHVDEIRSTLSIELQQKEQSIFQVHREMKQIAVARKQLQENIDGELNRLDLERSLEEEVRMAEAKWHDEHPPRHPEMRDTNDGINPQLGHTAEEPSE